MENLCSKGDIIILRHIKLARYGKEPEVDTRLNGHPYIVLNDVQNDGEYALCLKCSSSKSGKRRKWHYLVKNFKVRGHPKKYTYIDVANVYRIEINSFVESKGKVSDELLKTLIGLTKKFGNY